MRKTILKGLFLSLLIIISLSGCNSSQKSETITVFAAASLADPLSEIRNDFKENNPGAEIVFNFDSSGTLRTQINEGAQCDIFFSASKTDIEKLEHKKIQSQKDLLSNYVVLASERNNADAPSSYDEMFEDLRNGSILLGIGNSDVPAGRLANEILAFGEIDPKDSEINSHISYGSNVKELVTQVKEGMVDCAIVYLTDALAADLSVAAIADSKMCDTPLYSVALLDSSSSVAASFFDFLGKEEARLIFDKYGFLSSEE